jgi:radical SAM protein with 4Fe4S-binding SPASM domain
MLQRLLRRLRGEGAAPRAFRVEAFGGIAQTRRPRALVFVDRAFARELGHEGGPAWADPAADGALGRVPLAAPLEAHLQLTNRCDVGCQHCYTGATPQGAAGEWGLAEWRRAVDVLADAGVFHLALGGGESATLPWLGELARHARSRGLVPNLTTSGLAGLANLLPIAHLFGQINVSIDGLGADYERVRGVDGFAAADAALRRLRAHKREVGINVVVTRHTFAALPELFAYVRRRKLNELELLRFKPQGRGIASYAALVCTDAQHRAFLPTIERLARRHRVRVRVDCSYTPMLAHHDPGPALLASLAVYGCTGGDFLIGARASGVMTACSFAAPPEDRPRVTDLAAYWSRPTAFGAFRRWQQAPAEPCASCRYHALCRGGCKVVSAHLAQDLAAPDPECPRVVDWRRGQGGAAPARRVALPVI